jgi:2-polyprenyl-6-methoxyphenol hydroxylase-like FAD-dependent oxidoreductase
MERREFLQTLYDGLPDHSRILFNKKVSSIKEDASGVDVTLTDGITERLSVVT